MRVSTPGRARCIKKATKLFKLVFVVEVGVASEWKACSCSVCLFNNIMEGLLDEGFFVCVCGLVAGLYHAFVGLCQKTECPEDAYADHYGLLLLGS